MAAMVVLSACSTWKHTPLSAGSPPAITREQPTRVTRTDRSTLVLRDARVEGDSVIGNVGDPPMRHAVALSAIQSIEQREINGDRTLGAAVGGAVLLVVVGGVVLLLSVLSSWSGS